MLRSYAAATTGQVENDKTVVAGADLVRAPMAPDGRYLLFVSANRLVAGDTDGGAKDVCRYDAGPRTGVRVSTSVSGGGGRNGLGFDASVPVVSAMSADGSTVIFDTAEALSPGDTNSVGDLYGRRDERVSSFSACGGGAVGITASVRDIFLGADALVPGAGRNVSTGICDARLGDGLASGQAPSPCSGDRCRGQRGRAPRSAGPSAARPGGGLAVAPMFSVRAVSAARRRASVATGQVSLTMTANAARTTGSRAASTIGGRSAVLAPVHAKATAKRSATRAQLPVAGVGGGRS